MQKLISYLLTALMMVQSFVAHAILRGERIEEYTVERGEHLRYHPEETHSIVTSKMLADGQTFAREYEAIYTFIGRRARVETWDGDAGDKKKGAILTLTKLFAEEGFVPALHPEHPETESVDAFQHFLYERISQMLDLPEEAVKPRDKGYLHGWCAMISMDFYGHGTGVTPLNLRWAWKNLHQASLNTQTKTLSLLRAYIVTQGYRENEEGDDYDIARNYLDAFDSIDLTHELGRRAAPGNTCLHIPFKMDMIRDGARERIAALVAAMAPVDGASSDEESDSDDGGDDDNAPPAPGHGYNEENSGDDDTTIGDGPSEDEEDGASYSEGEEGSFSGDAEDEVVMRSYGNQETRQKRKLDSDNEATEDVPLQKKHKSAHATPLTQEEKSRIEALLRQGMAQRKIGEEVGVTVPQVSKYAKRAGLTRGVRAPWVTKAQEDQMQTLLRQGMIHKKIAQAVGVTRIQVVAYAKRAGLTRGVRAPKLTKAQEDKIRTLLRQGMSHKKIAQEVGTTFYQVQRFSWKAGEKAAAYQG